MLCQSTISSDQSVLITFLCPRTYSSPTSSMSSVSRYVRSCAERMRTCCMTYPASRCTCENRQTIGTRSVHSFQFRFVPIPKLGIMCFNSFIDSVDTVFSLSLPVLIDSRDCASRLCCSAFRFFHATLNGPHDSVWLPATHNRYRSSCLVMSVGDQQVLVYGFCASYVIYCSPVLYCDPPCNVCIIIRRSVPSHFVCFPSRLIPTESKVQLLLNCVNVSLRFCQRIASSPLSIVWHSTARVSQSLSGAG